MSIIYRKIARDLLHNKTRTLLVVLSTAVGILALGMVMSLSEVMTIRMTAEWEVSHPAHVALYLNGAVDEETALVLARTSGVADIEPVTYVGIRWKRSGDTEWHNGRLVARQDYRRQKLSVVDLQGGQWPRDNTLSVERQAASFFNLPPGSWVMIKTDQFEREIPVVGAVRDLEAGPPQLGANALFFSTLQTAQDIAGFDGYDLLLIRLPRFDRAEAQAVAERLQDRLKKIGLTSSAEIQDPKRHFIMDQLEPVLLIMGVLGALSLALSAFLVVNTVNAVLTQQVSQIGMMKAVGATAGRVMRVYLAMVLSYGLMAVVVAVPLAALAAYALAGALLRLMNIELPSFQWVPRAVVVQLVVGLLVPMLAALWPVLVGVRVTVREAIASYGLGADFGNGPIDRLIAHIRGLPCPLALSLRNTFRRKGRVALTLVTLTIAGVMFMTVMSTGSTLTRTMEVLFAATGNDVEVDFDDSQYFERAEAVARRVPGVVSSELWEAKSGQLDMGGNRKRGILFMGLPPDSIVFNPTIIAGRWLRPDDENMMVINQKIAQDEELKVGDRVNLNFGDKGDSTWEIVGVQLGIGYNQYTAYVPRETFSRVLRQPGRGNWIFIKTDRHDPAYQAMIEKQLCTAFEVNAIGVIWSSTSSTQLQRNLDQFNILTYLLLAMSVLAGMVGSLGLMGTMSINVLERSKEIGVMRAIGASSRTVVGIFVIEGVIVGLTSAAVAVPLSYPSARLFSDALGNVLFKFPLNFRYSLGGLALWIVIIVTLSALASLWPATRAARISVRETLAYE